MLRIVAKSSRIRALRPANNLLAALPSKDLLRLHHGLEQVTLNKGMILAKAGKPIEYAYFPDGGMISLLQHLADGGVTEVGLIGAEGFFGVPLILGVHSSPIEALVQSDVTAMRIPAASLIRQAAAIPALNIMLLRYAQALSVQITQTALCNVRHVVRQRLARWLLEAHDRVGEHDLPLSHELLSYMLGIRRAGVTVALGELSARMAITQHRGSVTVLDRTKLEKVACECYRAVRNEVARIGLVQPCA